MRHVGDVRLDEGDPEVLLRAAQAAYDGAVRDPAGQAGIADLVAQARASDAHEALVVALRADAWVARYRLDGPTALRYSKGALTADIPALERIGTTDVLVRSGDERDVLMVRRDKLEYYDGEV